MNNLFRIIPILILVFMSGCSNKTSYEGHWVDRYSERRNLVIEKNNSGYIITTQFGKYTGFEDDGKLVIEAEPSVKTFIDDNGMILFKGINYLRVEESMSIKGLGLWKRVSNNGIINGDYLKIEKSSLDFFIEVGDMANDKFIVSQTEHFTKMKLDKGMLQGEYYAPKNIESSVQLVDNLLVVRIGRTEEKFEKPIN